MKYVFQDQCKNTFKQAKKKVGRSRKRRTDQHPVRQKKREKAYTPLPITSLKSNSKVASTITPSIHLYTYKAVILSGFSNQTFIFTYFYFVKCNQSIHQHERVFNYNSRTTIRSVPDMNVYSSSAKQMKPNNSELNTTTAWHLQ